MGDVKNKTVCTYIVSAVAYVANFRCIFNFILLSELQFPFFFLRTKKVNRDSWILIDVMSLCEMSMYNIWATLGLWFEFEIFFESTWYEWITLMRIRYIVRAKILLQVELSNVRIRPIWPRTKVGPGWNFTGPQKWESKSAP